MANEAALGSLGSNIPKAPTPKAVKAAAPVKTTTRIILEENDNIPPTGQFFGINGRSYILRAGIECEVPQGIIDVLNNAVHSTPIIDPDTRQVVGYRNSMRYPYRVIREASKGSREE